jgi:MFS family permease
MNRSLLWLGGALFLWGVGESMFLQFQSVYLQDLGASPIVIGVILGAFGAAMTLTHIPAGHLSDGRGRRPMLIAAWSIGVLATGVMALATSLPAFVAGLLLYGFTAFVASPLDSYTTAARGKWSVGRAMTFVSMTFNGGAIIGPMIGGRIAEDHGFRSVYALAAAIFVLSTVAVLFISAQPRDQHDPENPPAGLLRNQRYLQFLGVFFFVAFAAYVPQPLSSNYLRNEQGLSLSALGQLISIAYLGTTILALLLGQLEARTGFLLGQAAMVGFTLILWKGMGLGWFAAGYFLLGGYRPIRSLGVAQVRQFVHKSQMGLAYGMAETLGSASTLLAPPLAGLLYAREPVLIYPTGLGLILVGIALTLMRVPRKKVAPRDHMDAVVEL